MTEKKLYRSNYKDEADDFKRRIHERIQNLDFINKGFAVCFFVLTAGLLSAQERGIQMDMIKNAFRQVLAGADTNNDGKLSMGEYLGMSKEPKKMEKNCKYWGANGDGVITEDEYVQQIKKIGRK